MIFEVNTFVLFIFYVQIAFPPSHSSFLCPLTVTVTDIFLRFPGTVFLFAFPWILFLWLWSSWLLILFSEFYPHRVLVPEVSSERPLGTLGAEPCLRVLLGLLRGSPVVHTVTAVMTSLFLHLFWLQQVQVFSVGCPHSLLSQVLWGRLCLDFHFKSFP